GGVLTYWVDAAATTTPLATPSAVATSGTYYIKSSLGSCTDIEAVVVTINPTPVLVITNPAAVCAPTTIDITAAAVTAGSTGGGVLSYWVDAAATATPLATPSAVATSGTYYIKSTVGSCTDIEPVVVTINPTPVLVITNPPAACAPNTVNITAAAVTAGSTGGGVLTYWVDAAATTTPLATPSAVATSGTYYIKSSLGSCTDIEPVVVVINPTPVLTITNPAAVCAPTTIDITAAAVTAGSTGGGVLTYWVDAAAATTPLATPSAVATSGTYYIKSTVGSCTDIEAVVVTINPLPRPTLTGGPVCVNSLGQPISSHTFNAGLDDINYDFEWFTIVNGVATSIAGENQNTFTTMTPGTYGVIATNITLIPNCPSDRVDGVVTSLLAPQDYISTPTSNYFADVQTISVNVTPAGVYEYQLDNGPFQSSNVFTNVGSGSHTINVRNECGSLPTRTVEIVDYPRYFTPNSDGIHDTWNIPAISGQANSTIRIFDRFGKLIKQIQPSGEGWNGTFNNQELPSTDYWFIVTYREDNVDKEFRSHFSMKR
uniref:T9SS type B sorting domain-containing protein n=1 Tax=Flavobacterium sp. TaxID=239 RepID=UPI0026098737